MMVSGSLLKSAFPHFRAITLARTRAAAPIAVGAGQPGRGRSKAAGQGSRFNRPPLVSRSGDARAVTADAVDDLVGGLGPFEGPGVFVPELDPVFERGGEL